MDEPTPGEQIGVVSNYFDHVGVAAIKLTGDLQIGDVVHIVGGDINIEQKIESIHIHHDSVKRAKAGDEVGIKVSEKVRKGYVVYKD